MHSVSNNTPISSYQRYQPNTTLKVFILAVMVLGVAIIVFGALAILASYGVLSVDGGGSAPFFLSIGEVNGYVLAVGGLALFILSSFAWCCQLRKEHQGIAQL